MGVEVRPAIDEDVDQILAELRKFASFYGSKKSLFPEDPETARNVVHFLIDDHLFLVAVDDAGKVLGFIAGFHTPHAFNPDIIVLAESLWWVIEDARGSNVGAKLLSMFLGWGQEHADWITMSLEHHSPIKHETLLRRGFKLQESSFLKET